MHVGTYPCKSAGRLIVKPTIELFSLEMTLEVRPFKKDDISLNQNFLTSIKIWLNRTCLRCATKKILRKL